MATTIVLLAVLVVGWLARTIMRASAPRSHDTTGANQTLTTVAIAIALGSVVGAKAISISLENGQSDVILPIVFGLLTALLIYFDRLLPPPTVALELIERYVCLILLALVLLVTLSGKSSSATAFALIALILGTEIVVVLKRMINNGNS
jgi:hypothetical protein